MKNTKKLTAILLTMAMLISILTMFASAASTVDSGSIGGVIKTQEMADQYLFSSIPVGESLLYDSTNYNPDGRPEKGYNDNVKWTLDSDGVLTISGSGRTARFGSNWASENDPEIRSPFYGDDRIKTIIIGADITELSGVLFENLSNLTTVIFMNASTIAGGNCIYDCPNIKNLIVGANLKNGTIEISKSIIGPGYWDKVNCYQLSKDISCGDGDILREDAVYPNYSWMSIDSTVIPYSEMLTRVKAIVANLPAGAKTSLPAELTGGASVQTPVEPAKPTDTNKGFGDVKPGAYYENSVKWAVEQGITKGTTTTTFSPNSTCTTAQILVMLYRAAGEPEVLIANPFTDVPENAYYRDAALWAYQNGMVDDNTFNGNSPCTRQSTVTYMWIAAGSPIVAFNQNMTDLPADIDAKTAISWAIEQGITKGTTNTTFTPNTTCTRAQIVTFLWRDLAE